LRRASPDSVIHAAQWAAGGVSLDDPEPVAWLLDTLHGVAATAAVTRLAIRAATYANLDSVALVASPLKALRSAGASDAVAVLTSRAGSAGISGTILDRPAEALWPGREPSEAPSQLSCRQDLQPKRSQTEL
jgi:hypothetical protein